MSAQCRWHPLVRSGVISISAPADSSSTPDHRWEEPAARYSTIRKAATQRDYGNRLCIRFGSSYTEAALMVMAVRAGDGMRVRILGAFTRAMPVVTTTIGLEGIEARPGEDVMVADTPAVFAQTVIGLLRDRSLQAQLVNNSRKLAEYCYDWQVVLQKMDKIYTGKGSDKVQNKRNGHA